MPNVWKTSVNMQQRFSLTCDVPNQVVWEILPGKKTKLLVGEKVRKADWKVRNYVRKEGEEAWEET